MRKILFILWIFKQLGIKKNIAHVILYWLYLTKAIKYNIWYNHMPTYLSIFYGKISGSLADLSLQINALLYGRIDLYSYRKNSSFLQLFAFLFKRTKHPNYCDLKFSSHALGNWTEMKYKFTKEFVENIHTSPLTYAAETDNIDMFLKNENTSPKVPDILLLYIALLYGSSRVKDYVEPRVTINATDSVYKILKHWYKLLIREKLKEDGQYFQKKILYTLEEKLNN